MESEIRIPWKRRWVNETNITEDVSDSGLRRNDVEYEGRVFFKEGNELQDLSKIPFLLLFGSAGSGKTTSLEDLQHILADNVVLAFDLKVKSVKVVNEEINLALKSDESNQKGKITVLIDSLDEAMLTGDGKACRELGEYICSYPKERINIRIGTRPHPFNPELISKIRDKHGGDSVQAFRLLPLSQNDVSLAAKSYSVDPDSFLKTLYKKGIEELAAEPITLVALLKEFADKKELPGTKSGLYEKMVSRLADEVDRNRIFVDRTSPELSVAQRCEIAENVAAAMAFSGSPTLMVVTSPADNDSRIGLQDILSAPFASSQSGVENAQLQETLTCGLFRTSGIDQISFVHLSYQEYLAAKWILRHDLKWEQLAELLWSKEDNQLYPHLISVASWLGSLDSTFADSLIDSDPSACLIADSASWTSAQKSKALRAILSGIHDQTIPINSVPYRNAHTLNCQEASSILSKYILDPQIREGLRIEAIDLAVDFELANLNDNFLSIAFEEETSERVKTHLLFAIAKIGTRDQKQRLLTTAISGRHKAVYRTLVAFLWPESMSTLEVLRLANSCRRCDVLSHEFETRAPSQASLDEIWELLLYILRRIPCFDKSTSLTSEFVDLVTSESMKYFDCAQIVELVARIICRANKRHLNFNVIGKKSEKALDNPALRLLLIQKILQFEVRKSKVRISTRGAFRVKRPEDSLTLVHLAAHEADLSLFEHYARLAIEDQIWQNLTLWNRILDLSQSDQRWKSLFPSLFSVDLNGDAHTAELERIESENRRSERAGPPIRDSLKNYYDEYLVNASKAKAETPRLIYNLRFDWDKDSTQRVSADPWRTRPGVKELTDSQRLVLLAGYEAFVLECLASRPEDIGERQAIYLFFEDISVTDTELARNLILANMEFIAGVWVENLNIFARSMEFKPYFEYFGKLIQSLAPTETGTHIRNWLDVNISKNSRYLAYLLDDIWTLETQDIFHNWAIPRQGDEESFATIECLLRSNHSPTEDWLVSFIGQNAGSSRRRNDVWLKLTVLCLQHIPTPAWSRLWPKLRRNIKLCLQVLSNSESGPKRFLASSLDEDSLADLWIWLQGKFVEPQSDKDGVFQIEPLSRLSDDIVERLITLGSSESVLALTRMASQHPKGHWIWSSLARARRNCRTLRYLPWNPGHLWILAKVRRKKFVRNESELMDDVARELTHFAPWLHSSGRIQNVWNSDEPATAKDEPFLSNQVCAFLSEKLSCVFSVREAEIGIGKTDIYVMATAIATQSRKARVVVELKWSHNQDAKTALKDQLKKQYLDGESDIAGIYLIGWSESPPGLTKSYNQQWPSLSDCQTDIDSQALKHSTTLHPIRAIAVNAGIREADIKKSRKKKSPTQAI